MIDFTQAELQDLIDGGNDFTRQLAAQCLSAERTIKAHKPILAAARRVAFKIWDSDSHSWNEVKDAMAGLICEIENLEKE